MEKDTFAISVSIYINILFVLLFIAV